MPSKSGSAHRVDVQYPITEAEVRQMISAAGKRGMLSRHMTHAEFLPLASWLSGMTTGGTIEIEMADVDAKFLRRWREAASLLKRTKEHSASFPNATAPMEEIAPLLEAIVARAGLLLGADRSQNNGLQIKPWATYALRIAKWTSARVRAAGGRGGFGRNSIAVQFTTLALERIGWRQGGKTITATAIASCCETDMKLIDRNLS